MRVSVIIPTIRYGGLDITFKGLGNQVFKDFELIIIDDVPKSRKREVSNYAKQYDIAVKYLRSKPPHWKANKMISNARNTGLIHAEGELIVFIDDYIYVKPEFLHKHVSLYKESKCAYTLMGQLVNIRYCKPEDRPEDISKIPVKTLKRTQGGDEVPWEDFRVKTGRREAHWGWFWTCNASAPLDKIIEINGFDEEYDGGTAGEDMDLGMRLSRMGCRFIYNPGCKVWHMDHDDSDRAPPLRYPEMKGYRIDSRILLRKNEKALTPYVNKGYFDLKRERLER